MKKIIMFCFIILSIINTVDSQELILKPYFVVKLHTDNDVYLTLKGYHDKYDNLYVNLESIDGIIFSSIFLFHSSLSSDNIVTKCKLDNDSISEYVILTSDYYSTYGASNYIVLWYIDADNIDDTYNWHLSIVGDYSLPELKDVDNDGIYEFIEYFHSKNKHGNIYRFNKGQLIPYKN
ncbi:MAG: hypothetical protein PWP68_1056 [Rikenellaceae bacterium]|nr:hypothetical protein [Rikenellaceae bacterium]